MIHNSPPHTWWQEVQKGNFNKFVKQLYWNCTSGLYSPVNMLHISRTHFSNNTSGGMLLQVKRNETWLKNNDRNSRVCIFLNCFSSLINSLSHSLCYYSWKDWICNFESSLLTGSAEVSLWVQNSQHIQLVYFIYFELRFLQ